MQFLRFSQLPLAALPLAALLLLTPLLQAQDSAAETRYLGNDGLLVHVGGHKILLDAFYNQSFATYTLVPEHLAAALLAGDPPYDDVELVFVSHVHGDHFSAALMLAYLRAQPQVVLICPQQVLDELQQAQLEPSLRQRIRALDLAPGDPWQTLQASDMAIDVIALPHAGGARMADVRNLVFRVALLPDYAVVHLGDAAVDPAAFAATGEFWRARSVQTAFPPYWFLGDDSGRELLREYVAAPQIIGIHVPVAATGQGTEWRASLEGDLFTDPGESRPLVHLH